jgi:hypothetical protein
VAAAAVVIVGKAFTVTVNVVEVLTQPFASFTVIFPVYVPDAVLAGTDMVMGLTGNAASITATKLLAGAAFQVIL